MIRALMRTTPWVLSAAAFALTAQAQIAANTGNTAKVIPGQIVVDEATAVVQNMRQNPDAAGLLDNAKAVLIVPGYGANPSRLSNSAQREAPEGNTTHTSQAMVRYGSPGVFLMRSGGWSAPAFFSISNVAADATNSSSNNGQGVPVVMMFMTSQALDRMRNDANNVSLSGLTVAHSSDHPRGSASGADVVIWAPHPVMMHQTDLAAAQIHYDYTASNAYYMNQATLNDILTSNVSTTRAVHLQDALSARVASK